MRKYRKPYDKSTESHWMLKSKLGRQMLRLAYVCRSSFKQALQRRKQNIGDRCLIKQISFLCLEEWAAPRSTLEKWTWPIKLFGRIVVTTAEADYLHSMQKSNAKREICTLKNESIAR